MKVKHSEINLKLVTEGNQNKAIFQFKLKQNRIHLKSKQHLSKKKSSRRPRAATDQNALRDGFCASC